MVRHAMVLGFVGASVLGFDVVNRYQAGEATVVATAADEVPAEMREAPAPAAPDSSAPPTFEVSIPATGAAPEDASLALNEEMLMRLEAARERLQRMEGYTAVFTQEVRKRDRLLEPQVIRLKLRHEPFSVFMQWERDAQQALYVEGENEDRLLVHPTRGFGRLRKVWQVAPDNPLAMREAVRPVTEIGLLNLVDQLLDIHAVYILRAQCETESSAVGDQVTTRYTLQYDSPADHPDYWQTHLHLCDETNFPVRIDNFVWNEDGSRGEMIESYSYSDLCPTCVEATAFDRENPEYHF